MNERPIPPAALRDDESVEMLRVWVAERKLHCSLKIGMYSAMDIDEADAWGTILSDTVRHIARALSRESHESEELVIGKIQTKLNFELATPSSEITGDFVEAKTDHHDNC